MLVFVLLLTQGEFDDVETKVKGVFTSEVAAKVEAFDSGLQGKWTLIPCKVDAMLSLQDCANCAAEAMRGNAVPCGSEGCPNAGMEIAQ